MAGTAAAIFPVFSQTQKFNKLGDTKRLCDDVVRGKLDEYVHGQTVSLAALGGNLSKLSVGSYSDSTLGGVGGALEAGGFQYAKVRYNRYFPYVCNGQISGASSNILFSGNTDSAGVTYPRLADRVLQLGMRECVGSNVAWWADDPSTSPDAAAGAGACPSAVDDRVGRLMPGFKLYVKLQLQTSWGGLRPADSTGTAMDASDVNLPGWTVGAPIELAGEYKDEQYSALCPNDGTWDVANTASANKTAYATVTAATPGNALYDFNGTDDAIRVTVTGVIDIKSMGVKDIGGIGDPNRLWCSASSVVEPYRYPVRYYLSNTGQIRTVHSRGLNGSTDQTDATKWVYHSVYNASGFGTSNILSFAVHPRNYSIYVLRPGALIRYSNCGGVPIDCRITAEDTAGIPDTGVLNAGNGTSATDPDSMAGIHEWTVNGAIRHIGVDFRHGMVYGASADYTQFYKIDTKQPDPVTGVPPLITTVTPGNFPAPAAATAWGRFTGFFISPGGDEAFVSDDTSMPGLGTMGYAATIYRIGDNNLNLPIMTMPYNARAFSQ
ncbi:MAG TPA: hypothetical protein VL588_00100 [Bdellovibrionota bacterium]|nr:hypothetical protein [Bdellovibrionota bacterium]